MSIDLARARERYHPRMLPTASVLGPSPRPRWPLVVAVIGLACALLPFTCSVHIGGVQMDWKHGGALFGGVVAMLFATYALVRRRGPLGARGRKAIALVAIGATVATYGYFTIERAYNGPDLQPAMSRIELLLLDGHIDELIAEADPTLQADAAALRRRLATIPKLLHDHGTGRSTSHWEYGPDGIANIDDRLELDQGTLLLRMTFRAHEGVPRLVRLDVVLPSVAR